MAEVTGGTAMPKLVILFKKLCIQHYCSTIDITDSAHDYLKTLAMVRIKALVK